MGGEKLWAHACHHVQTPGNALADGGFTVEPVYCLGLCSSSPAMAINDQLHARVDADKFDRLIAVVRSGA
jgi:NADH:ubiquinone oxidoreductase subunit E